jgi:hypothetical protein
MSMSKEGGRMSLLLTPEQTERLNKEGGDMRMKAHIMRAALDIYLAEIDRQGQQFKLQTMFDEGTRKKARITIPKL